jgi:hypothetical protein
VGIIAEEIRDGGETSGLSSVRTMPDVRVVVSAGIIWTLPGYRPPMAASSADESAAPSTHDDPAEHDGADRPDARAADRAEAAAERAEAAAERAEAAAPAEPSSAAGESEQHKDLGVSDIDENSMPADIRERVRDEAARPDDSQDDDSQDDASQNDDSHDDDPHDDRPQDNDPPDDASQIDDSHDSDSQGDGSQDDDSEDDSEDDDSRDNDDSSKSD